MRVRALSGVVALVAFSQGNPWVTDFHVDKADFASTGHNNYFSLEPGFVLTFDGGTEHLVITVLNSTKVVDGVETRIIEERETNKGQLVEVSLNYFAINKKTNDVYYFGEYVNMYKDGKVTGHEGSWLAGDDGAKYGLAMPAQPVLHQRYHQEVAPKVAMDRAEIVSLTATVTGGAGPWKNCVKVEETTPLEPATKEYKYYASGIGLVQDGDLKLVSHGMPSGR
jgi:hypothetical protein